jgi:hypothetical protein
MTRGRRLRSFVGTPIEEAMEMAKISRESAPRRDDHGVVADLAGELEGYTINFVTLREDLDGRALLRGAAERRVPLPALGLRHQGPGGRTRSVSVKGAM